MLSYCFFALSLCVPLSMFVQPGARTQGPGYAAVHANYWIAEAHNTNSLEVNQLIH